MATVRGPLASVPVWTPRPRTQESGAASRSAILGGDHGARWWNGAGGRGRRAREVDLLGLVRPGPAQHHPLRVGSFGSIQSSVPLNSQSEDGDCPPVAPPSTARSATPAFRYPVNLLRVTWTVSPGSWCSAVETA
ncbi:hypothetical protein GCM10020229_64390 [Kitasatospora albolonga]